MTRFAIFSLIATLFSLLLKALLKLRLAVPFIYLILANTLLADWAASNDTLSTGIFFGLLGLVALSWLVTGYKKIRYHFG